MKRTNSQTEQRALDANELIVGDCLDVLKEFPDRCVDMVYADPPFFSNKSYETVWGDTCEIRSFSDRWEGGINCYIAWLFDRVEQMHRVLKNTGCMFLHCDWHANAYIRVYILDKLFGDKNFRNEFVWKRSDNRSTNSRSARKNYDTIFFYSVSKEYTFNQCYTNLSGASRYQYKNKDERGIYRIVPLLVSGRRYGETGKAWKETDPNQYGKEGMHWVTTHSKLDNYEEKGLIYTPAKGNRIPYLKYYLDQSPGVPISELWDDIKRVQATERVGYPTQKPEPLLERIINCASNENDLILDPFVGGGTTVAVAERLKRRWIGIDQSPTAVHTTHTRLQKHTLSRPIHLVPQQTRQETPITKTSDSFPKT